SWTALLVHQLDDPREDVRIRVRQHTVSEVEDVPLCRCTATQDVAGSIGDDGPGREHDGRVEVSLHSSTGPDALCGLVERDAPVDPDDIGTGLTHQPEQLTGADAEVDPGHLRHRLEHPRAVRQHIARVV